MAPLLAGATSGPGIDWFVLAMQLAGGLAVFLLGMEQLSDGLQAGAGSRFKRLLARLTRNRWLGAVTGALATAALNSSSVTTVLVVGFISAGVMTLSQAIGVIMGANIGTTITAQIVAFHVTEYALLAVAAGFLAWFAGRRPAIRHLGMLAMGLGFIFHGMGLMSQAMAPLRAYAPFHHLMTSMTNPVLGILVGAAFTALVQSSSATTGLVIVFANQGLITLEAGVALTLGANLGTCVTAVLASLGKTCHAKRAALAHVLFNLLGVALWAGLIPQLATLARQLTATVGASGTARDIANAHTLFNVANSLLLLPFADLLAKLVSWLLPERRTAAPAALSALDDTALAIPAVALQQARAEAGNLGDSAARMLGSLPLPGSTANPEAEDAIQAQHMMLVQGHDRLLAFLSRLPTPSMSAAERDEVVNLVSSVGNIEAVGATVASEMLPAVREAVRQGVEPAPETMDLLRDLTNEVQQAFHAAVAAVRHADPQLATEVIEKKNPVHQRVDAFITGQAGKLGFEDHQRLQRYRAELEIVDRLKRVYALSKRIARSEIRSHQSHPTPPPPSPRPSAPYIK